MLKAIVLSVSLQLLLSILLLVPAIGWGDSDTPLWLEVLPTHQFAPGHVRYKIRVQSHRDNIGLCFGYSQPNKFRRSCMQLNGIYSPRLYWQEYHDLPAAEYEAFVELYRAPNRIAAKEPKKFIVLASDH